MPPVAAMMIISDNCHACLRGQLVWVYKDEYRKIKTAKEKTDYVVPIRDLIPIQVPPWRANHAREEEEEEKEEPPAPPPVKTDKEEDELAQKLHILTLRALDEEEEEEEKEEPPAPPPVKTDKEEEEEGKKKGKGGNEQSTDSDESSESDESSSVSKTSQPVVDSPLDAKNEFEVLPRGSLGEWWVNEATANVWPGGWWWGPWDSHSRGRGGWAGQVGHSHSPSTEVRSRSRSPLPEAGATPNTRKVKICNFWASSSCQRGKWCSFAHPGDLDTKIPPLPRGVKYRRVCGGYVRGYCAHGQDCLWPHGQEVPPL